MSAFYPTDPCRLPGRPSKYNLAGRRTTANQDPDLYIQIIQKWFASCRKNHKTCNSAFGNEMPTRVVDVGGMPSGRTPSTHVRLISTNGIQDPYIALSYCWGVDTSGVFTLNAETYSLMTGKNGIPHSKLAKTHREVISLVRALGFRYLWIDALCIIQADAADWERESKTMARVYGNAALTVIAGRSAGSKDGFITNELGKGKHRPPPCALPLDGSKGSATLMIDLRRSANVGPVSGRGWCFQERMISPRAVVFGEEQLSFVCASGFFFEDGGVRENRLRPKFLQQMPRNVAPSPPTGMGPALTPTEETLKEWYNTVTQFTQCSLSNPHDVFAAITAVAQQAAPRLNSRYLAGLWECDIIRGLLWRPCYQFQVGPMSHTMTTRPNSTRLTKEKSGEAVIRAPSWSWAAVEGPIAHSTFNPLMVARHRDEKYRTVRPTQRDRWSRDGRMSGVDVLHMPSYDLHLTGHVVKVRVLERSVASYFKSRKWNNISSGKAVKHGVLLARDEASVVIGEQALKHLVGIGFFDVRGERDGVKEVWCFPIMRDMGLILKKKSEGKFARLGWFVLDKEKEAWFLGRKEEDICLC